MANIPNWRQIQKNNFTKVEELLTFLQFSPELKQKVLYRPNFVLNLPQRLASKIEKNTLHDPILRQFLPLTEETITTPGFLADPVQDQQFRKTKKILHKYNGRALLVTTSACAMNCRFCFRQNFPYETEEKSFEAELTYITQDSTLSEIILSGGDPLSLSNESLHTLFTTLNTIPHIKRIRFHTRFPIGIPERIDPTFLQILASSPKQIFFILHSNHAKELDNEVLAALKKIAALNIPLLNQSVLLQGVNDNERALLTLCETLTNNGIIPYYLHCLDPVQGAHHFSVSEERGHELIRHLQQHLSGYGIPRLVREEPGKPSKTFL